MSSTAGSKEMMSRIGDLKAKGSEERENDEVGCFSFESTLCSLKIRKAAGPDNISARLLKTCASQLSYVFLTVQLALE